MKRIVHIRTIDCSRDDARALLAELRARLSPSGDVVSPAGNAKTLAVFGEPLSPRQVVERICTDVRNKGLAAALDYTEKLDGVALDREGMRVTPSEMLAAYRATDPALIAAVRRVRDRIRTFQTGILHRDAVFRPHAGAELSLRYRPLRRVGVCVPGGAAAYPSTVLMTVTPAQAAGVDQIAVVVPPTRFGGYNNELLAACHALGVTEVYRIGGAQAVAALAYGVEGIERVDKIVGPGNLFVALAKQHVYGEVDIDSIAGPSEVVVLADDSANPRYLASELICQAEHSPGASLLITWHEDILTKTRDALGCLLENLSRGEPARDCLERFGALILARDEDEAVELTNAIAPEHLQISSEDPYRLADRIANAGAIFLGQHAPVAAGDYAAGPSHVLPTGGTARWASGLTANDFLKRTSLIWMDRSGLENLAPDIRALADAEGLTAHRLSVDIRLEPEPQ